MSQLSAFAQTVAEREQQVCELSKAGCPVSVIANEVGLSSSQVVRIRKKHNLKAFVVSRFTLEETQLIFQLLEDGCSYNEVARTTGRHLGSIARKFPGYGWKMGDQIEYAQTRRKHGLIKDRGKW